VQLNQGTSEWWLAVAVIGGSETTVKVEMMDSGSVSSYTTLVDQGYAFVYDGHQQLKAPISLRLTSSTGKQVVLTKVFNSLVGTTVNTGMNYGSTSTPTTKPTTRPTKAPTALTNPVTPPSGLESGVTVSQHPGNNGWWFAVMISGADSITSVEIMDSSASAAYTPMTYNQWGYAYNAPAELVAPISVRVVTASTETTATFDSVSPNQAVSAL